MNKTRKIAAYALAALLLGSSAGGAFAQTAGGGGSNATGPAASSGQTANRDNANRNDDRGWDWGWLGLIGLAGLAGLMRRDRTYPETTHRSGVGTTSTAAR